MPFVIIASADAFFTVIRLWSYVILISVVDSAKKYDDAATAFFQLQNNLPHHVQYLIILYFILPQLLPQSTFKSK